MNLHFQAIEFFFFAILIGIVTLIFAIMSYFYKYVSIAEETGSIPGNEQDESAALIPENSNQIGSDTEHHTEGKKRYKSESEF